MHPSTSIAIARAYPPATAANDPAAALPTTTVSRERYVQVKRSRDMYQRLYDQDRSALAAERAANHKLRLLLVSHGIDPEVRS